VTMNRLRLLTCVVALTGCDAQANVASNDSCGDRSITGTGVGAVRVRMSVDSLKRVCRVAHDTVVLGAEGMSSRVLTVVIGSDSLDAEIDSGQVWRLRITSSAFTTVDSLRVGMPLAALARRPGAHGAVGEGKVFVLLPDRCGMSFGIANSGAIARPGLDSTRLRALSTPMRVDRILVFGCAKPAP
jgi:hypothetical protein